MPVLRNLNVTIPTDEVLRLHGYPSGRRPRPIIEQSVTRQVAAARELIRPAAVYDFVNVRRMTTASIELDGGYCLSVGAQARRWHGAEYLAIAVCTIGPSLESEVSRLLAAQDLSSAAFLDAAGSVAVESLAEIVGARLCRRARQMGMAGGLRLSPGHGDWALNDQAQFFRLLRPERISVSLSRSFLMLPLKSVSFAIAVGKGVTGKNGSPCLHCGMARCAYRRLS